VRRLSAGWGIGWVVGVAVRWYLQLLPTVCHVMEQYANNAVEADHGRLKARLRPMRGLSKLRSAHIISTGHAFVQNLRRGHYELGVDVDPMHRIPAAFAELAHAI
jgi:transposase, IS6 family